jgi:hypothetical protein
MGRIEVFAWVHCVGERRSVRLVFAIASDVALVKFNPQKLCRGQNSFHRNTQPGSNMSTTDEWLNTLFAFLRGLA